ncbi:pyridoxamine 5'-phosphate oxidase family protein [Planococcus sp. CPCC 101016]|uniref:pyridoxamine 5'-phosphate oxidase family protein n=1 Tax=Planococcus sp. CPCC 101016 TaxID=2599617 RepID=UPI0011B5015F|nr:pyridoxamine 5'-phosphate oxidase family protein [Planococcus sp. CPCC 101016]TWT08049.1 pyridoxamine 5'-phosphate oxidase family protein [Planococcus sp. CPCC 101016]
MKTEIAFQKTVKTVEELLEITGKPSELVNNKVISYLDEHCLGFISQSPFLTISTADETGFCDVSPRGDEKGFVHVMNEKQLIIPERPGNKRMDSMRNILSNPNIGLLFLIPGLGETLRINGKASVIRDEELLEKMAVNGKRPILGIGVDVEECFIHCAKAFRRSELWNPETWMTKEELPKGAKILAAHAKLTNVDEEAVGKLLEKSYREKLY